MWGVLSPILLPVLTILSVCNGNDRNFNKWGALPYHIGWCHNYAVSSELIIDYFYLQVKLYHNLY